MNITLIPPGNITSLVPQLLPYLEQSAQWSRGRAKADDIVRFILNGQMHLWVAHDERGVHGHVITEVKQYPQCKMFVVQYCAGRTGALEEADDQMQALVESAAQAAGCAGIEFIGRPGWRQTARKYGYEVQSVSYQKFFGAQQ